MADVTPDALAGMSKSVHTTDEAHARMRRRRTFEWRFRMAGAGAILLAALALASLLWTVVFNAYGAFKKTYIKVPVELAAQTLELPADADAETIRGGNFEGVVKKAMRNAVPTATGRSDRRKLYDLISDGAALSLRAQSMENTSLIGTKAERSLLASDDVDLWVKGYVDKIEALPSRGRATPVRVGDNVRIVIESNDFQTIVSTIKSSLREGASRLRARAAAENRGVRAFEERLKSATTKEARAAFQERLDGYKLRANDFLEKAKIFDQRADAPGGTEKLFSDLPSFFVRINGGVVRVISASGDVIEGPEILPLNNLDAAEPGEWSLKRILSSQSGRRINDKQAIWLDQLERDGRIERKINWDFLSSSNSREAELAGLWGALVGSFWTMVVTFLLAFPIGVMAAIYLEEFAPKNAITDFIEVNINNLAAVPSIVFGLLGLAVFISFFGVPRSTALAGGIVLALMTLPTIIIASRAAIKAVPPSIRQAALGIGASRVQTATHHVLPLAMPGILTGTIIGMAQALGETAPLLLIGMFAFIREVPSGITEPATALPVQIYQWSDFPERLFEMKTAAAIVILLLFLIVMNAIAILLRKRFERRW